MDFNLSEPQKLLQQNIYESCLKLNRTDSFQHRWKHIASTGIVGTCVDEQFNGSGLGALELILALEAMALANEDNGLSFAIAAHTLACITPLNIYGTSEQKKKFISKLISGDQVAANAMTESESGSDVFNIRSTAEKRGNGYLLNGIKVFISNSDIADIVVTFVATDKAKGFFGGITCFILEADKFQRGATFGKMGLTSCSLGEIIFNDEIVPEESIVGKVGGGGIIFNKAMEWERICMAGIHLGSMQRVLNKTVEFAKSRKSHGQSIGKFQSVSHELAEMKTLLEVSRAYSYKAAWMLQQNQNVSEEAAIVKLFVSENARKFMLKALQIFGGYGYISEYGIEEQVRDTLAATIYSGTSEIQKNIIVSHLGI